MYPPMNRHIDRHIEDPRLTPIVRRLRELPAEAKPPYDWTEFSLRAARSGRSSVAARLGWRHAALAAGVAVAIMAVAMWSRFAVPTDAPRGVQTAPAVDAQWHRPDIAAGWLEALPSEPAIVRVDTHLGVMDLEDSIAWVDEMLTIERAGAARTAQVMALQRERSRLVDSLVRVRYAETLAAQLP
jgi:hypothetical protein